jgi:hypothetical protein
MTQKDKFVDLEMQNLAPFSTHTHGGWHSSTRIIADIEVEKKLREQRS